MIRKWTIISLCAAAMLVLDSFAAISAVSLRSIRRKINEKEYMQAKADLEEGLGRLSGGTRTEAVLMLAGLQTGVDEAGRLYHEVVSSGGERESLRARLELAKIYYSLARYREAIDALSYIPSRGRSEDRFEAIYFKGLSWKELGDADRARTEFEKVDRGDYLYWSYMALAEIDIQYGRIDDAVERYETIAGSHSNPIAGFKLGECYEILGEREKALNVYSNLARLFPQSLEAPKAREKIQIFGSADRSRRYRSVRRGGEREEAPVSPDEHYRPGIQYYTLQFGAFSVRENAEIFLRELSVHIEGLRIESADSRGQTWHRVRVGNYASREMAEADALRFMEQTGYSSKVLPVE